MSKVAIIGAGTWGIALANLLSNNQNYVVVWARNENKVKALNSMHTYSKLNNAHINEKVLFTCDMAYTIKDAFMVVMAVPSNVFREVFKLVVPYISENVIIVSVTKGIEDKTLYTMSEIIEDELSSNKINNNNIVALSGPTHAEEVIKGFPTVIVSASKNEIASKKVQDTFMNDYFRVYTNVDIKGVQVCAAFKNIIAIASGILTGLGYGDNIRAALITRGLAEMVRVGEKMGCLKETFYGLTGIGDMVVTATSLNSRNFRFGKLLGSGMNKFDALNEIGMVVEGVNFLDKAMEIRKKYNVELPITEGINDVINNNQNPNEILTKLMTRKKKSE